MPPKIARVAIRDALKSLEESNFRDFCDELTKSEGKPRIWPSDVEKKSRTEVMKVLVSDIGCNDEADELGEMDLHSCHSKGHFVDRNRNELIERVSNVAPILDHLLQEKVLRDEQYDEAMTKEYEPYLIKDLEEKRARLVPLHDFYHTLFSV
uniref:CARD domain-containing protein n=1 Tax=Neogobius melanostomus TaxID=47308 RepID=A0A8C6SMD2_9GOBI